jgi:hypothetical protein
MDNLEQVIIKIKSRFKKDIDLSISILECVNIISDFVIKHKNTITHFDVNYLDEQLDIIINDNIKEQTNFNKIPEHKRNDVWELVEKTYSNNNYDLINKVEILKNLPNFIKTFGG